MGKWKTSEQKCSRRRNTWVTHNVCVCALLRFVRIYFDCVDTVCILYVLFCARWCPVLVKRRSLTLSLIEWEINTFFSPLLTLTTHYHRLDPKHALYTQHSCLHIEYNTMPQHRWQNMCRATRTLCDRTRFAYLFLLCRPFLFGWICFVLVLHWNFFILCVGLCSRLFIAVVVSSLWYGIHWVCVCYYTHWHSCAKLLFSLTSVQRFSFQN